MPLGFATCRMTGISNDTQLDAIRGPEWHSATVQNVFYSGDSSALRSDTRPTHRRAFVLKQSNAK
jgi:hypothetical protein